MSSAGDPVVVGVLPVVGAPGEIVDAYREAQRRGVELFAVAAYEPPDFWAVVPCTHCSPRGSRSGRAGRSRRAPIGRWRTP